MKPFTSRAAALDAALAESQRLYRGLDEGSFEPFNDECDRMSRESRLYGRNFYEEMTRWKESEYDPEGREACEKAACDYEASLDDLFVALTHQTPSETLQQRIARTVGLQLLLGNDLRVLVTDYLLTTGQTPPQKLEYLLIGGYSHGSTAKIEEGSDEYESEVFADEDETESVGHQTYRKLHFEGVGFGAGFECYGLAEDDRTETRELARYLLQERKILSHRKENGA